MESDVKEFSRTLRSVPKLKAEGKLNEEYMLKLKDIFKTLYQNNKEHKEIIQEKWNKLWNLYIVKNIKYSDSIAMIDDIEFGICDAIGVASPYKEALDRFDAFFNTTLGDYIQNKVKESMNGKE